MLLSPKKEWNFERTWDFEGNLEIKKNRPFFLSKFMELPSQKMLLLEGYYQKKKHEYLFFFTT